MPTSPIICASIIFGKFEVTDWAVNHSTYVYILMNNWIAINTTTSNRLKNCQTCSKLHQLYTSSSKYPPPARTKISDVVERLNSLNGTITAYSLKCTRKHCIDGTICHFEFPKVVLAYSLGEVVNFCMVLLPCHAYQFSLKLVHSWSTQVGRFFETWCTFVGS